MATAHRAATIVVATLLLTLLATAGFCCFSGLLIVPTAETIGNGQYSYEYQTDGVIQGITAQTRLINNQFGVGDRLEVGADIDAGHDPDSRLVGNAKYVAFQSRSGAFAAAFGVYNLGRSYKPAPYAVTTTDLHLARLHVGTMSIDGTPCCIFGADKQLGKMTLMADYTSGPSAISSLGFNYQIKENFGIAAGVLLPRDGDAGFTLHFVWCKSLKCPGLGHW